MKWSFLLTFLLSLNFLVVFSATLDDFDDSLDYDPRVAILCGKVAKHVDVDTGGWVADKNSTSLCTTDKNEILRYCKAVYPTHDVRNIVESNNRATVDGIEVTPYRCLVGAFESDALLVPAQCRFEHMHFNSECRSHDEWRTRASNRCTSEQLILEDYGVLIPCNTGLFTGVEFVCCPSDMDDSEQSTDAVKVVTQPTTTGVLDLLKSEISKFAKLAEGAAVGCDRKQYHNRRDQLEEAHSGRVKQLVDSWKEAEKRYNVLRTSDKDQAATAIATELENFKNSLSALEDQAKLERAQLKEEHHQCTQIDLNYRKQKALREFVTAMQEEPRDGNKILTAVQQYVKTCTQDRLHNLRYFDYIQKHYPARVEEAKQSLQNHFILINEQVNKTMILLFKLPEIARQFQLDLPDWIPKLPALPTEKPTVGQSSSPKEPTDTPTDPPKDSVIEEVQKPTGQMLDDTSDVVETEKSALKANDHKPTTSDLEDLPENEGGAYRKTHSSGTFAAVIGLSCGALVIMIIIVIAMAMRRTRPSNNTKTVLVDGDNDTGNEKSHLIDMQENGYENPTYRFYDY